jgi:hypothetical protein
VKFSPAWWLGECGNISSQYNQFGESDADSRRRTWPRRLRDAVVQDDFRGIAATLRVALPSAGYSLPRSQFQALARLVRCWTRWWVTRRGAMATDRTAGRSNLVISTSPKGKDQSLYSPVT